MDFSYDDGVVPAFTHKRFTEKPNLRNFVSRIREQVLLLLLRIQRHALAHKISFTYMQTTVQSLCEL